MCSNNNIINLIISEEGPGLTKFSTNEEAESSSNHSGPGTEYKVKGANIFVISREKSARDCHR